MTRVALAAATGDERPTRPPVDPASDNGATGRRWPELAHQLAQAGLAGDALFSAAGAGT